MAYEPQTWVDGEDGGTPLTAERLNHMEAGIADGQNASAPTWETLEGKPEAFAPESHTHDAGDVASGTFSTARIPSLAQSKITGLVDALAGKADKSEIPDVSGFLTSDDLATILERLDALENPADETE